MSWHVIGLLALQIMAGNGPEWVDVVAKERCNINEKQTDVSKISKLFLRSPFAASSSQTLVTNQLVQLCAHPGSSPTGAPGTMALKRRHSEADLAAVEDESAMVTVWTATPPRTSKRRRVVSVTCAFNLF